ncbi:MAG: hypothetical protein ACE5ID_03000, partial [Acidobacteriota bacterium]
MQEITLQEPEGDDLKGRLTGLEPYLPARFWVSFEGSGVSLGDAVDEAGRFTLHGIPSGGHGTIIVRAQNPEQESGWLVA